MINRPLAPIATCVLSCLLAACGSSANDPTPVPPSGEDAGPDVAESQDGGQEASADSSSDAPTDVGFDAPTAMKPGDLREITAGTDGTLRVDIPTSGSNESYIAVLYSAAWETNLEYSYQLQPSPSQAPKPFAPARSSQTEFLARAHAPWKLHPSLPWPPAPTPSPAVPPTIGEHRTFKVMDATWSKALDIDGECIKVGSSLAIWLDRTSTLPKPADIDPAKLGEIVAGFEGTVLPRHRKFFGQESDVDQDGLIHILYTPIFAKTGVVAYFSPCDLKKMTGCKAFNNMELIYSTPPDQISAMMSSVSSILETTAHEVQHAIYFHRKFLLNSQTNSSENPYITEAFSGMGEDLSGYGNGTFYIWASTLQSMADVSGPDLLDSSIVDYDTLRDATLRGAGYLLYRYLYEQAGSNEFAAGNTITDKGGIQWLNSMVDSPELGQDNIEKLSSRPISELMFDWYTTLVVSNRPGPGGAALNTDPKFNYLPVSWDPDTKSSSGKNERHGADLFADNPMTGEPLTGPTIAEAADADGVIRSGGVDYLRFTSSAAASVRFTVTGEAGSNLRLRVLREK